MKKRDVTPVQTSAAPPPAPVTLRLRCAKGHEYTGEPMPITIDATGAMLRRIVLLCPFCLLALAQTIETQVVGDVPGKPP